VQLFCWEHLAVDGSKISVGPPYFNLTFVPLMIPLLMAVPLGPLLSWKRADLLPVLQRLYFVAGVALVTVIFILSFTQESSAPAAMAIGLGVWVILGAFAELYHRAGFRKTSLKVAFARLRGLPASVWGVAFAHCGLGVMVLGIVGATVFSDEQGAALKKGGQLEIAGFTLVHDGTTRSQVNNFVQDTLHVSVRQAGVEKYRLAPAKRFYVAHGSATTEASIKTLWFSQLYLSVGDTDDEGRVVLRAWWKSNVILVWLGAILMSFGGCLSLFDRRLRIGAPVSSKAKRKLADA